MIVPAYAGDISPGEAWKMLDDNPSAALVDVRTPAEWNYVGVPDLSSVGKQPLFVPWLFFPSMEVNQNFAEHLENAGLDREAPLLFICRSGARSRSAAIAMTARGFKQLLQRRQRLRGRRGQDASPRHRVRLEGRRSPLGPGLSDLRPTGLRAVSAFRRIALLPPMEAGARGCRRRRHGVLRRLKRTRKSARRP